MKKLLVILFGIMLFACSKEKETEIPISIKISKEATADLYIFDLSNTKIISKDFDLHIFSKSGSPVFTSTFSTTAADLTYKWNAKTSDGNKVADGMYTYTLKNKDKTINQDGFFYVLSTK